MQFKQNETNSEKSEDKGYKSGDTNMPNLLIDEEYYSSNEEYEETHQQKRVIFKEEKDAVNEKIEATNKEKHKALRAKILLTIQLDNDEWIVLLGLVNSGSSKILVKLSSIKKIKEFKLNSTNTTKWKTKARTFSTNSTINMENVKLPQFTKHKEFDMKNVHVYDDPDEKYNVILGRDVCQKIGLDILNSTQQFKWYEHLINMMPAGYWKKNKTS